MLFAASGVLKVTDFGIAKVSGSPGTVLTRMGEVIGTPAYIAPEQARGLELSPATDVYGVATMLYELLAGVLPFPGGGDEMSLLFQHAFEKPVPLLEAAPGVPEPVAAVVMHGLATEPADRYATAESFGVALAEAGAQAWGPGWLLAEPVPIMDAGAIISAGGQPAAPGRTAAPAGAPTAGAATAPPMAAAPTAATPAAGPAGSGAVTVAPGTAAAVPETVAAPAPGQPAADSPHPGRRRQVIIAAVVVAVIVAVIVIILQTHLFTVYKSNGIGPFRGVMYG
jgi:serine/threonine-protein kinase